MMRVFFLTYKCVKCSVLSFPPDSFIRSEKRHLSFRVHLNKYKWLKLDPETVQPEHERKLMKGLDVGLFVFKTDCRTRGVLE